MSQCPSRLGVRGGATYFSVKCNKVQSSDEVTGPTFSSPSVIPFSTLGLPGRLYFRVPRRSDLPLSLSLSEVRTRVSSLRNPIVTSPPPLLISGVRVPLPTVSFFVPS